MKRLYQITLYSHSANNYIRLLVTVRESQTVQDAEREALKACDQSYRGYSSQFICMTPDDVFTEI